MLPALEVPPADERDTHFDAAAARFAAPLARLAAALEDGHSGCEALLQDIHVALWRSFADYDAAIPLRTWVFRVALQAVANHQPNMQDKDPRTMPGREAWASRRRLEKLVSLDEVAIGELRSPTGLIHQLKALDREIAVLYLEGFPAEEAVEIGGWPLAHVRTTYERIGKLLLPGAREAWQQRSRDAQPVTRFLVQSRIGDLRTRHRRAYGWALAVVPALTVVWVRSFHRRRLERQLDEIRRRWGWRAWVVAAALLLLVLSYPLDRGVGWTWPAAIGATLVAGLVLYRLSDLKEARRIRTRIEESLQPAE